MITLNNFYSCTKATFKACKRPKRKPDYKSDSGSKYWYGVDKNGEYVIRHSDHWVDYRYKEHVDKQCRRIASCYWSINIPSNKSFTGKCYLKHFRRK